jgi:hypothetical protein
LCFLCFASVVRTATQRFTEALERLREREEVHRRGRRLEVVVSSLPLPLTSFPQPAQSTHNTPDSHTQTLPTPSSAPTDPSIDSNPPHLPLRSAPPALSVSSTPPPALLALSSSSSLTLSRASQERMPRPAVYDSHDHGHGAQIPTAIPRQPERERGRAVQPEVVKCVSYPLDLLPSQSLPCG